MLCKRYTYKMKNESSAIEIENSIVKKDLHVAICA